MKGNIMKVGRGLLCVFIFTILFCSVSFVQSQDYDPTVINPGLVGIEQVRVQVIADVNFAQTIEDKIAEQFTQAGLNVSVGGNAEQGTPQFIVRVAVLQGMQSGQCIYHVQSSFARMVYLRESRTKMTAEVWRADVPIGICDINDCEGAILKSASLQVDAFIAEWKKVNTDRRTAEAIVSRRAADSTQADEKDQAGSDESESPAYQYVASRNSKVFHRADCSFAAKIKPENTVRFATRQDAIDSGRRPCSRCKP
jgi:hypothetical protein